jgi:ABC-type Fe3+ transport system permease subunit
METALIRWQRKGSNRHSARTWMIRAGLLIIAISGSCLALAVLGVLPLSPDAMAWNNIRILSGAAIVGCLLAAVGYGNE